MNSKGWKVRLDRFQEIFLFSPVIQVDVGPDRISGNMIISKHYPVRTLLTQGLRRKEKEKERDRDKERDREREIDREKK